MDESGNNGSPPLKVVGRPFTKGFSGNPAGRPKGTGHAKNCRYWANRALKELGGRLQDASFKDVLAFYVAVSAKGGFLDADRMAIVDSVRMRLATALLEVRWLTAEQRAQILEQVELKDREVFGADEPEKADNVQDAIVGVTG